MTPNIRTFPLSVRAAFVVAAFVVTLIPSAAQAQVVLNPGYISGTIAVNGETITNGTISASWTDGLGTHYSASAPVTGSTYNLAVQVPAGSTPEYTVSVSVNLAAPSALSFPSQFATVTAFATTTVNFIVDPGYIAASVTATTGSVSFVQFTASGDVAFASASASGASRTFPVYPAAAVTVFGNAVFSGGGYSPLDPQTVSVAAGATVSVSWLVTPPPPTLLGSMAGMYSFIGAVPDESTIEARCLNSNFATLTSNGSYLIPNLLASNCTIDTFATFNSGTSYLFLPDSSYNPTRNPAVSAGATTTVDINATAAFLSGTLELTGTKTLADATLVSLAAYGVAGASSGGGLAGTSPSLSTGEYNLVLTDGPWSPGIIDLQFFDDVTPGAYLQEVLQFVDNQAFDAPVVLAPGEAGVKNLTYGVGTVTVTFSVAGGGLLSNPSLFGTCYNYDPLGNLLSSYFFNSYGNQVDVTLGSVTFVGMAGTCTVVAFADVAGSNTRFGETTVVVVPGTVVVIDLDDPVNTPPAVSLLGSTPVLVGTTQTYTFAVTDPDAGATFTVTSVSCGLNGSQVGVTTTTATGGSVDCLFPAGGTSTVSVQVADNHSAPSNTAMLVVSIEKLTTTTAVVCPASVDYSGAAQTPCTATVTSSDSFSEVLTVIYTDNVSAGTATASAVFAGDATHYGSDNTETFAINAIATTTVVTCPASVNYSGAAQTPCSATVTSVDGFSQSLTVTYADNVNAGTADADASYGGDANHTASADSATFAINPLASSTVVSCPASVDYTGLAQTPCSATVTSADGLSQSVLVTYSNNINAGTATASAAYAGDGNHTGSVDSETFEINALTTTTVVTCPASVNYTGAAQTPCSATVTSADGLNQSVLVTYSNNTNAGTAAASAAYAGDGNHTGSGDSETFAINAIATTTVVTCPASVNYTGAAQTPCSATVTSAGGFSEAVTVTYTNNTNAGTATANAVYAGDGNHTGSDDSETFAINAIASSTVVTCPDSVNYTGAAQTPCTAIVSSADGLSLPVMVTYAANINAGTATASATYSGDVNHSPSSHSATFLINALATVTVVNCPLSVNYTGAAHTPCAAIVTSVDGFSQSLPVTYANNVNAGTATANAVYAGDGNHNGSFNSATFAINPLATATVVTCPVSVLYNGAPQTPCFATVSSVDGFIQSLTVSYANHVNPGTATASAAYAGDGNHSPSSGTTTFAINPNSTTPTTTTIVAPTITYAANGIVTVTVSAPSGTVTGTVALSVDGGAAQSKTLVGGSATFTVVQPNAGNHALSATFAAQGNFGASNATGTLVVNQSPTATTLTSTPNPSSQGQLVTLKAIVTSVAPGSGQPTGTVTFKDGLTVLGTAAVNGAGQAVLTTSSLALGPHTLTATYAGSANYKTSSGSTSHLVFAYASGGGTFAIGDLNSAVGTQVTFWGAQWWKKNSLSGVVYAPAAFKGFITTPLPSPPVVGGGWQTDPGNSSNPPATIPTYVAVVVTSSTTKSGSLISGNIVGLAIVRTDAGYAGNPGHAGTGTIVAVIH